MFKCLTALVCELKNYLPFLSPTDFSLNVTTGNVHENFEACFAFTTKAHDVSLQVNARRLDFDTNIYINIQSASRNNNYFINFTAAGDVTDNQP